MRGQLARTGAQMASRSLAPACQRASFPLTSGQLLRQGTRARLSQPISGRRYASSSTSELKAEVAHQERVGNARSGLTRLKNLVYGSLILVSGTFVYLYVTDTRSSVHQYLVPRAIRTLFPDAEDAHHFGNDALKALYTFGLHPRERGDPDAAGDLRVEVFGHVLDNPIGTSAGLDKNAEIVDPVLALGPGLVEVGGITPLPQEGNPKPRVWRVPSQNALINRYGLNSEGAESVAVRLRQRLRQFAYDIGLGLDPEAEREVLDGEIGVPPGSHVPGRLLAVQVAKMKGTPDSDIDAIAKDYTDAVGHLAKYADILVVNVSSPNTPGLRALQASEPLTKILSAVVDAAKSTQRKTTPAVMVKVSPDEETDEQVTGICAAVWASGVDGVIVGNTTKKRPDPLPAGYALSKSEQDVMLEMGGYSGPQMFERTLALVKKYRTILDQGPQESAAPPQQEKRVDAPPPPHSSSSPEANSAPVAAKEAEPETPSNPPSAQPPTDNPETFTSRISASLERDVEHLKPQTPEAEAESSQQPLIKLPERHSSSSSPTTSAGEDDAAAAAAAAATAAVEAGSGLEEAASAALAMSDDSTPTLTPSSASSSLAAATAAAAGKTEKDKVIFATGGITNGAQALQVLNAGASVAFVYTALVYGGAGTISRIKREMREEMRGERHHPLSEVESE